MCKYIVEPSFGGLLLCLAMVLVLSACEAAGAKGPPAEPQEGQEPLVSIDFSNNTVALGGAILMAEWMEQEGNTIIQQGGNIEVVQIREKEFKRRRVLIFAAGLDGLQLMEVFYRKVGPGMEAYLISTFPVEYSPPFERLSPLLVNGEAWNDRAIHTFPAGTYHILLGVEK